MLRILSLLVTFALTAAAEQRQTAFQAYANVPRSAALRLAKVAACEGAPEPERWHFIVHEPGAETGLRDYVIADGQIAAMNGVSQFAEVVTVEDVLALNSVRIDSDYVARIATRYAVANSVRITSMNYELHKERAGVPVWKVTCLDPSNRALGWLTIDAGDGRVTGQSGFELTPVNHENVSGEPTADLSAPVGGFRPPPRPLVSGEPNDGDDEINPPTGASLRAPAREQTERDARPPAGRPRQVEVRRAEPVEKEPPPQRHKFLEDLFRPGRKLFPF